MLTCHLRPPATTSSPSSLHKTSVIKQERQPVRIKPLPLIAKGLLPEQAAEWKWQKSLTQVYRAKWLSEWRWRNAIQQQPFYGLLSRTTRVNRYQKKHSPLPPHHPDHQPIQDSIRFLQISHTTDIGIRFYSSSIFIILLPWFCVADCFVDLQRSSCVHYWIILYNVTIKLNI